jgi:cell wall assembly regulator SMI1
MKISLNWPRGNHFCLDLRPEGVGPVGAFANKIQSVHENKCLDP